MLTKLKTRFFAFLVVIGFLGVASAQVPIVVVPMEWVHSYETVTFDTPDGDLGLEEYAVKDEGEWYIREVPKSKGNFISTTVQPVGKDLVNVKSQKSLVNPECLGCSYYSEFRDKEGEVIRVSMEQLEYASLRGISGFSQPSRKERVSVLSARDTHAAIAFDNVSVDTANGTSASSISWSHTINTADNTHVIINCSQDNDTHTFTATFDGVSANELGEMNSGGGADDLDGAQYNASIASTGAKTVVCTSSDTDDFNGTAVSYTGVQQVDIVSDMQSGGDDSTTPTEVITTVSGSWVVMFCAVEADEFVSTSPGANQTQRFGDTTYHAGQEGYVEDEIATGGTTTVTCERSDSNTAQWIIAAVELEAAAAGGGDDTPVQVPQLPNVWIH